MLFQILILNSTIFVNEISDVFDNPESWIYNAKRTSRLNRPLTHTHKLDTKQDFAGAGWDRGEITGFWEAGGPPSVGRERILLSHPSSPVQWD